jgi:hypothetical protein
VSTFDDIRVDLDPALSQPQHLPGADDPYLINAQAQVGGQYLPQQQQDVSQQQHTPKPKSGYYSGSGSRDNAPPEGMRTSSSFAFAVVSPL